MQINHLRRKLGREAIETRRGQGYVLVGLAALALGLRFLLTSFGALFLIGAGLSLAGAALILAGIQRARFRSGGRGSGVVGKL